MMFADIIPTHTIATWLLTHIDGFLDAIGLRRDKTIEEVIYVVLIVAFSIMIGLVIRYGILFVTRKLVKIRNTAIGHELLNQRVFTRCSHVITPLVFLALVPFAFPADSTVLHVIEIVVVIYSLVTIAVAINTVLTFIWSHFNSHDNTKNLPLKGILNIAKGVVWSIVVIIAVSILLHKSPGALLTGLGAFAAALMLIFKDSILGFVAGIQLSQNDMLHVGDWIVVPSTIADGIVEDVSLTAVKVRNWNNTIVTLPPYTLVSTSFQNWSAMTKSGHRLISRAVFIDTDTVCEATPDLITSVSTYPGMADFIAKVKGSGQYYDPSRTAVNGTLQTNLGLFRAYICNYLINHPQISKDAELMVRVQNPTPNGYPLEIYCFTTVFWVAFEAVQSEIFEHIAVMAPKFGLRLFNSPSGENILALKSQN